MRLFPFGRLGRRVLTGHLCSAKIPHSPIYPTRTTLLLLRLPTMYIKTTHFCPFMLFFETSDR